MFGTSCSTPLSAYHQSPMECYRPTMPPEIREESDDNNNNGGDGGGDDNDNNDELQPLPRRRRTTRGGVRTRGVQIQEIEEPRRIQPTRRRRRPPCGTSSNH